jgi:hypothetical protein
MASARMPDQFYDLVAHHLPPEPPWGPALDQPSGGGAGDHGCGGCVRALYTMLALPVPFRGNRCAASGERSFSKTVI